MDFDWKSLVRTVAPAIGTALGGPLGGTAVRFLADKLLGDPGASEDQVAQALQSMSPNQLLRLKELDQDFAKHMADIGVDLERIAQQDRQSAREMAKTDNRPQMVLSTVYTLAYLWYVYLFFTGAFKMDPSVVGLGEGLILVLTTAQTQLMNFWFGSSSGSREKTTHLANSTPMESGK